MRGDAANACELRIRTTAAITREKPDAEREGVVQMGSVSPACEQATQAVACVACAAGFGRSDCQRRVDVAVPQTSTTTLPSGAYVVTCTGPETELPSILICRSRSTTLDPVNEPFTKLS